MEDVLDILMGRKSTNPNILQIINEHLSIRKGKYGPYLFYKTSTMKRPKFLNIKGVDWKSMGKSELINWCRDEHGI